MPNQNNIVSDESMQRILQKILGQMPDVKPVTMTPSSSSFMTRVFSPKGAQAVTNPFTGNISYNSENMQGMSQDEMENTVAHELTHSRQAQNTPWYQTVANLFKPDSVPQGLSSDSMMNNPYVWRPHELDAFQTERNRQMTQPYPVDPVYGTRDIILPPSGKRNIKPFGGQ